MKKAIAEILKMQADRDWKQFHTPGNLAKSISIEASELLECFQWNESNFNRDDVIDELADVTNYCLLLADSLGVNLEDAVLNKIERNKLKYPVEKVKGKSDKYTKY